MQSGAPIPVGNYTGGQVSQTTPVLVVKLIITSLLALV